MDRLGWAGSITVRVGAYHLGVRASSEELLTCLSRLLRPHVVNDPEAGANFSVQVVTEQATGRPFHFLFQQSITAVRSPSPQRVVRGLLSYLTMHALEGRDDLVAVHSLAFVRDGRAVLVPHGVRLDLKKLERHFNRAGLVLVDMPRALIDARSGEVVVPDWELDVDPTVLDRLSVIAPEPRRLDAIVAPGRYPIAVWAFGGDGEELSAARAVSEAVTGLLHGLDRGPEQVLPLLSDVLTRVPAVRTSRWERDTIELLAARAEL